MCRIALYACGPAIFHRYQNSAGIWAIMRADGMNNLLHNDIIVCVASSIPASNDSDKITRQFGAQNNKSLSFNVSGEADLRAEPDASGAGDANQEQSAPAVWSEAT